MRTDAGGQPQLANSWVAVVRYRYSGAPMKLEDRFINPLGFQVTGYRKDPEAITPQTAPTVPSGAGVAALGGYYNPPVQPSPNSAVTSGR